MLDRKNKKTSITQKEPPGGRVTACRQKYLHVFGGIFLATILFIHRLCRIMAIFCMNARAAGSPIVVRISLQDIPSVAPTAATDPAAQLAYTGQPMSIIAGIATVTVVAGIALAITARRRAHA